MEGALKPYLGFFFPGECYEELVVKLNFLDGEAITRNITPLCTALRPLPSSNFRLELALLSGQTATTCPIVIAELASD